MKEIIYQVREICDHLNELGFTSAANSLAYELETRILIPFLTEKRIELQNMLDERYADLNPKVKHHDRYIQINLDNVRNRQMLIDEIMSKVSKRSWGVQSVYLDYIEWYSSVICDRNFDLILFEALFHPGKTYPFTYSVYLNCDVPDTCEVIEQEEVTKTFVLTGMCAELGKRKT